MRPEYPRLPPRTLGPAPPGVEQHPSLPGTRSIRCPPASVSPFVRALSRYRPAMDWHDKLTAREREVLALREAGKTVREIGEALHMTPGTVRVFLERIEFKRGNE